MNIPSYTISWQYDSYTIIVNDYWEAKILADILTDTSIWHIGDVNQ